MQNKYRSLRTSGIRAHNRHLLLQLLRAKGSLTRPAIVEASGLSPAAVSNVVTELAADGLVSEAMPAFTDEHRRVGRPAATVVLEPRARCVLAVQIGANSIQIGAADLYGELLANDVVTMTPHGDPGATLDAVAPALRQLLSRVERPLDEVLGIGVGAAGLVDRSGRRNLVAVNSGWRDVPIADRLEAALGLPATIDHNVRAMAMAEARYGHGVDVESLMFVYARTGLGVGLVLDGNPYRGGRLGSNEIAHIAVGSGVACTCGKQGCVETMVSDRALLCHLREASLTQASDVTADVEALFVDAVEAGDTDAVAIRDRMVGALATALAATVELIDPEVVVVGGLLDACQAVMLDPLREATAQRLTPWTRDGLQIVASSFGAACGLIGAATLALDTYLFGSTALRESIVDARTSVGIR